MNDITGRYLLFCGRHYYPVGGFGDFNGHFSSVEEAKDYYIKEVLSSGYPGDDFWCNIVDTDIWEIVDNTELTVRKERKKIGVWNYSEKVAEKQVKDDTEISELSGVENEINTLIHSKEYQEGDSSAREKAHKLYIKKQKILGTYQDNVAQKKGAA